MLYRKNRFLFPDDFKSLAHGFSYQKMISIPALKNCAQNLSEISKYIEEYRKGNGPEKPVPTGEIVYFLRFRLDCGRLHTVEVTGSNPVSPTTFFSTRIFKP
jgi:hypothetical protein